MSGGTFDYKQNHIRDIILQLNEIIQDPENAYSEELAVVLDNAMFALKAAYIYAQRLDWFFAGDDSEETMYERLGKELTQLAKEYE